MKEKRRNLKRKLKTQWKFYLMFSILFISSFFVLFSKSAYSIDVESDPRNDMYRISVLDFLYVIGDEYPDTPDDLEDLIDIINKMITRSQEVDIPDCIDIREVKIFHGPLRDFIQIDMDGDIDDCDYVYIMAIIDSHTANNWIGMSMEYDDGHEEFHYRCHNGIEDDNATGGFTGHTAWMSYNATGYYYREGDDVVVLSITGDPDFEDFLQSYIYYDFCPNSQLDESITIGSYTGTDPITQFLDDVADFLFGWLFEGALPFLILMFLFLVVGQILFDRRNVWLHWIGFGVMAFCLYPIIMYMLSVNLVGVMGIPNIFGIVEVIVLWSFIMFIGLSWVNGFTGFIRYYKIPLLLAFIGMIMEQIIYMYLYSGNMQILGLILLSIFFIAIYVILIYSKKFGRNKS